jgi:hypothetical protein
MRVRSDWTPGSRYEASHPRAPGLLAEGQNLKVDPPRRLVQGFRALWSEDVKREGTSRVTWEIEPVGDSCRLTVTHDELREDANPELYGGWPMILSGVKTLLETGDRLTTPGSLRYGGGAGSRRRRLASAVLARRGRPATGGAGRGERRQAGAAPVNLSGASGGRSRRTSCSPPAR